MRNPEQGATLIEVMGAVALFAISLASVLALIASTQSMGLRADKAYNAYNIARNHMEFLRTISFDNLDAAEETDVRLDATGVPDEEGEFYRTTEVTMPYQGDAQLALVEVGVTYEIKGSVTGGPMEIVSVIRDDD